MYILGDNGKYYVPPIMVSIFRTKLVPRAYMITPNQFEAELLTGIYILTSYEAFIINAIFLITTYIFINYASTFIMQLINYNS